MKTTHQKAIGAYRTLTQMGKRVTGQAAFTLFRLKKELKDIVNFQSEEEEKLIEKYGGAVTETGLILIDDPEKRKAFNEEIRKIGSMECEIAEMQLPANSIPDITLEEIEILDGMITFEEE